ncbi:MAG: hypothetical protein RH946_19235 [Rhodospirillales bacterium]|tara:strand:+ start:2949 stop:3179 length:231 start_codon:yes stop_codon:yes gene_type:complete
MSKDIITSILAMVSIVFLVALGIFYIQEGSFEGAGARMDSALTDLPDNAARAASETAETANDVIEDIADGPDDENG